MHAAEVALESITYFIHGTTLALNALLTRKGSKAGIITTRGFRDVYLLGRTDRTPMYDFKYRKPESLVERYHIFEIPERLDFEGNVLHEFDVEAARLVSQQIVDMGVQSVAVSCMRT